MKIYCRVFLLSEKVDYLNIYGPLYQYYAGFRIAGDQPDLSNYNGCALSNKTGCLNFRDESTETLSGVLSKGVTLVPFPFRQ